MSAAITAKIRGRKILLIGNNKISDKVSKAHTIKNYPGFIDVTGKELSQAFNNHLKSLSIDITEDMVNAVYAMGKYFHIQGKKNNYEALTVILATGVDVSPIITDVYGLTDISKAFEEAAKSAENIKVLIDHTK